MKSFRDYAKTGELPNDLDKKYTSFEDFMKKRMSNEWKNEADGLRDDQISLGYIVNYLKAKQANNQMAMAQIKAQIDRSGYDDRLEYYLNKCKEAFSNHAQQFSSYDRYPAKGEEFNCIEAIPELKAAAKGIR
jgi:hypothetical protein